MSLYAIVIYMQDAERYNVRLSDIMNKVDTWKETSRGIQKTNAQWKTENEELRLYIKELQEQLQHRTELYGRRYRDNLDLRREIKTLNEKLKHEEQLYGRLCQDNALWREEMKTQIKKYNEFDGDAERRHRR